MPMIDPRDLDDLVAIKRAGSLSAAAKRRGVVVSTISRRIDALETALKLRLIDRQTSGARLTRQGLEIASLAEPLASQIERIEQAANALRAGGLRLPVRITATEFVVAEVLAPALARLWAMGATFPVHLQSQGEIVSLAGRGADIAIRMSRPEGASLIVRKLTEIRLGHYASRAYLAGRDPAKIDFRDEKLIVYDDSYGRMPELDWISGEGLVDAVAMRTGSTRAQMRAALTGSGIAQLPHIFASREPDLIEIAAPTPARPRTPWLIIHRDLQRQPNVRLVSRWIVETFSKLGSPA
jgi:DNA-binding transcriptional LysR family regulator